MATHQNTPQSDRRRNTEWDRTLGPNAIWSFGVKDRVSYAERPWKPYFFEILDKSVYFWVGFIAVIFQLKKSWLLYKNLIASFRESKYGV